MHIIGMDPSLSNWGMAHCHYNPLTHELTVLDLHLIETTPNRAKFDLTSTDPKSHLDLARSAKIHTTMQQYLQKGAYVCAEIPVGSQSARAMCSYGVCVALLSTVQQPFLGVTPNQVKAVVGKHASKADIIQWAHERHPAVNWLKKGGRLLNKNEHLADAIVAVYATVRTKAFQQWVQHHASDTQRTRTARRHSTLLGV